MFRLACRVAYYLFPLPVAWLALSLMSQHMKYHDIGVNSGANNGFLMFFLAPPLLLLLYAVAGLADAVMARGRQPLRRRLLVGGLLTLLTGTAAFVAELQYYSGYPSDKPKDVAAFLSYVLANMGPQ